MEGSAGLERAAFALLTRRSGAVGLRQSVRWLFSLPNHLGASIAIVAVFSAIVLAIAAVYGAPLSLPRERVSAALGVSAALPVAIAIGLYVAMRAFKAFLGGSKSNAQPLLPMVATDITLMVLFLIVTYFHFNLKTWVQVINPVLYDDLYFSIDENLRPVIDLFYWIRSATIALVPQADAWYQGSFLLMFITGFCSLSVTRNPVYPLFCVAVLLTMSIGALTYLVAPALGPFIFEKGLNESATAAQAGMLWAHQQAVQGGMEWIAKAGPSYFTGGLAAMPSLHIAHALVMTYFIYRARSPLIGLFLLICLWVTIESIASRWHYLIDLPAGLLVALLVITLTNRICSAPATRVKSRPAEPAKVAA